MLKIFQLELTELIQEYQLFLSNSLPTKMDNLYRCSKNVGRFTKNTNRILRNINKISSELGMANLFAVSNEGKTHFACKGWLECHK